MMWEFKFYSRGGQGAVTAAKILVNAAILEGKFAQAIPSYGQERKGAPVFTYARISDTPIDVKAYVYRPNWASTVPRVPVPVPHLWSIPTTLLMSTRRLGTSLGSTLTRSPTSCWVRSPQTLQCWVPWPKRPTVSLWIA